MKGISGEVPLVTSTSKEVKHPPTATARDAQFPPRRCFDGPSQVPWTAGQGWLPETPLLNSEGANRFDTALMMVGRWFAVVACLVNFLCFVEASMNFQVRFVNLVQKKTNLTINGLVFQSFFLRVLVSKHVSIFCLSYQSRYIYQGRPKDAKSILLSRSKHLSLQADSIRFSIFSNALRRVQVIITGQIGH
jgi:hypothetical protein